MCIALISMSVFFERQIASDVTSFMSVSVMTLLVRCMRTLPIPSWRTRTFRIADKGTFLICEIGTLQDWQTMDRSGLADMGPLWIGENGKLSG